MLTGSPTRLNHRPTVNFATPAIVGTFIAVPIALLTFSPSARARPSGGWPRDDSVSRPDGRSIRRLTAFRTQSIAGLGWQLALLCHFFCDRDRRGYFGQCALFHRVLRLLGRLLARVFRETVQHRIDHAADTLGAGDRGLLLGCPGVDRLELIGLQSDPNGGGYSLIIALHSPQPGLGVSAGADFPSTYPRINSRLISLEAHTWAITAPPPRHSR